MFEENMVSMVFERAPVRVIQTTEGLTVFPIVDIAKAIGYSRQTLRQIINRNEDLFQGWFLKVMLPPSSPNGGRRDVMCVTKEGLMGLLLKIVPSRVKDAEKRERLIRFRCWAIEAATASLQNCGAAD